MKETKPQPIKKRRITSGTREWADRNINCVKGCSNDCRYCYAKLIAKRFGRCTEETWKQMQIRSDVLNRTFRKHVGRVMFPSSHDITDAPEVKDACIRVIKALLEAGDELLITTKPRISVTTDIVRRFYSFHSQFQFRFTITSVDNGLLSFWEPGAPPFEERLESLKYAYKRGFKTSVSIEPFLDYDPRPLVEILLPFVTESIWVGPMNYIPRNGISNESRHEYEATRSRYDINHLRAIHENLRNLPRMRFKDSMINKLELPM
jgi:DNA repair photolyase